MRRPIAKREHRETTHPRPRAPSRRGIAREASNGRSPKWLLWSLLFPVVAAVSMCFWFQAANWLPSLQNQTISSAFRTVVNRLERKDRTHTPTLVFENLKASINHPLPIGMVLINGVGEETVVLSGLIEGASLSVGAPLTATRWSLPGRDLDNAFVSAPENFEGVMDVVVTLYSSTQDILESKQARFEWNGSGKSDKLPITVPPNQHLSR